MLVTLNVSGYAPAEHEFLAHAPTGSFSALVPAMASLKADRSHESVTLRPLREGDDDGIVQLHERASRDDPTVRPLSLA